MNHELTMGSLFDGSGGFPLGGLISGITPVWASEIEPFPVRMYQEKKAVLTVDGKEIECKSWHGACALNGQSMRTH